MPRGHCALRVYPGVGGSVDGLDPDAPLSTLGVVALSCDSAVRHRRQGEWRYWREHVRAQPVRDAVAVIDELRVGIPATDPCVTEKRAGLGRCGERVRVEPR